MRLAILTALFGVAAALPQAIPTGFNSSGNTFDNIANFLLKLDFSGNDVHDLNNGSCRDVYFLMARGSGEWGTLVSQLLFLHAGI
jgi:hypothetical protein